MNELLELLASPWNLLWVLITFGFAPGFCLRLIVLIYPAEHPRRRELLAELYAMKRSERPIFVMEQLETAIFDGGRARRAVRLAERPRLRGVSPGVPKGRARQLDEATPYGDGFYGIGNSYCLKRGGNRTYFTVTRRARRQLARCGRDHGALLAALGMREVDDR